MTRPHTPRSGRTGSLVLLLIVTIAGCSSPTSPTRPPTQPSPGNQRPALILVCPTNQEAAAATSTGLAVTYAAPVPSGGVAPIQASCTPASGSVFPVGTSTVHCTATDSAQATSSCSFTITVAPPPPELSRTRFLAFGDSMTAGEVSQPTATVAGEQPPNLRLVLVPSAAYPTQLLNTLRARYTRQLLQLQVTNAGLSGEWAEEGTRRLPGALANVRPEAVLLLEGANDLSALGTPGVQRASRAIDTMAREVRSRGARLFLATLPPSRGTSANAISPTLITALNSAIRTTARGENAVLVDLFAALSTDVTRYIGPDGLHPTEAGYLRIAQAFFDAIRADLEVSPR